MSTAAVVRAYAGPPGAQIHYRVTATPFPVRPPVVMIHQAFHSGRVFEPVMQRLGIARQVFAPDLIGHGDSDALPAPPSIGAYAASLLEWLAPLAPEPVDLVGYHLGSAVAVEMAAQQPARIRQLVLIGVPAFEGGEREAAEAGLSARSLAPREDGSQFTEEWQRSRQVLGIDLPTVAANFLDKLKAGTRLTWGARAALGYPVLERLGKLDQPVTVLSPHDDLVQITPRARRVLRDSARYRSLEDFSFGLFDLAPDAIAALLREVLEVPAEPAQAQSGKGDS